MPKSSRYYEVATAAISDYLRLVGRRRETEEQHWCGASGPVADLEGKLKQHYGTKHALCVANATMGLFALCLAAGIRGRDFITTPLTYGATLAGWLLLKNRPIFADIDPASLNLDPVSVRKVISPKTKAIVAVDMFGVPADMKSLRAIADKHGIWYFADASQSLGATIGGLPASTLADALVVSFTGGKSLFAGEGGAVLTNNTELYQKLVWMTQHPARQRRELSLGLDNEFGINARISPLSAALAAGTFSLSMKYLRSHQTECFRVVEALNDIGVTTSNDFRTMGISPTFFRLTAAWKGKANQAVVLDGLRKLGLGYTIRPLPARLIYRQKSFEQEFPKWRPNKGACPRAEREVSRRFELIRSRPREEPVSQIDIPPAQT